MVSLDTSSMDLLYWGRCSVEGGVVSIPSAAFRRGCREACFTSPGLVSTQRVPGVGCTSAGAEEDVAHQPRYTLPRVRAYSGRRRSLLVSGEFRPWPAPFFSRSPRFG